MHSFEDDIDASILAAMMEWAKPIPRFRPEHASLALFCSTVYLQGVCEADADQRMLFALNSAYWWWLDDLIDENIESSSYRVPWEALVHATRRGLPPGEGSFEVEYLRRLSDEFRRRASSDDEHRWWLASSLGTLGGFRESDENSRARRIITYAEHLEGGFWSTSIVQVMATASLLFGLGFGARTLLEPTLIERLQATIGRLENDLHSVERGRREGCLANAVLIMEEVLPAAEARTFVAAQIDGYGRRLATALKPLGDDHPVRRLSNSLLAAHRRYYGEKPARYA
jgi:hypothetical protein